MRRLRGETIVRREIWRGRPKVAWGGILVEDSRSLLALYMPEGSPLAFADDFFGAPHLAGAGAADRLAALGLDRGRRGPRRTPRSWR